MRPTKEDVVKRIREAFAGVTLGNGVGLAEGRAIDCYEHEAACKSIREQDEKHDWQRISVDALNQYNSSLCFFDAEGMRFHLPAFMLAELNGEYDYELIFHLTYLDELGRDKLIMLSREQREAVREFLMYMREESDYRFNRPKIDQALSEYWKSEER